MRKKAQESDLFKSIIKNNKQNPKVAEEKKRKDQNWNK